MIKIVPRFFLQGGGEGGGEGREINGYLLREGILLYCSVYCCFIPVVLILPCYTLLSLLSLITPVTPVISIPFLPLLLSLSLLSPLLPFVVFILFYCLKLSRRDEK